MVMAGRMMEYFLSIQSSIELRRRTPVPPASTGIVALIRLRGIRKCVDRRRPVRSNQRLMVDHFGQRDQARYTRCAVTQRLESDFVLSAAIAGV